MCIRDRYELFGAPFDHRIKRVADNIQEIRRLWTEGGVTPLPIQNPVPLWGGFYGPRGARTAGRLGIGLLHISHEMYGHYQAGLIEGGHDPSTARVADLLPVLLADDPEEAWARITPHLAYQMNSYRQASVQGTGQPAPPIIAPEHFRGRRTDEPWGALEILTAQDAAVRIHEKTAGLPVQHLIFWASIAGMPDDLVTRNIELVSQQLPALLQRQSDLVEVRSRE